MTLDKEVEQLISGNVHLLVPWYLILSYAYYHLDVSLVSDALYDRVCRDLLLAIRSSAVDHRHLSLCDVDALEAGTAYRLRSEDYPSMATHCAKQFILEGYTA